MRDFRPLSTKPSAQRGLTLIEVLVSMALGVFFLGIAVQYLVVGQASNQVHDAGSRIQENARFANNLLREAIRLSGYNGDASVVAAPDFIFTGNCGGFNPCSRDGINPATNVGDSVAVSLVADGDISQDCLGNGVDAGTLFANVFWVQQDPVDQVTSLFCRGWDINGGPGGNGEWMSVAQPLVDGVQHMQVQYGLSNVANEDFFGPVVGFLSAAGVQALDGGSGDAWQFVRAVRVSLLVDSGLGTVESNFAGAVAYQADTRTYELLDGPSFDLSDGRLRRAYTFTVELNNSFE